MASNQHPKVTFSGHASALFASFRLTVALAVLGVLLAAPAIRAQEPDDPLSDSRSAAASAQEPRASQDTQPAIAQVDPSRIRIYAGSGVPVALAEPGFVFGGGFARRINDVFAFEGRILLGFNQVDGLDGDFFEEERALLTTLLPTIGLRAEFGRLISPSAEPTAEPAFNPYLRADLGVAVTSLAGLGSTAQLALDFGAGAEFQIGQSVSLGLEVDLLFAPTAIDGDDLAAVLVLVFVGVHF